MNSKTLRRLNADHGALHNQPLPPNYLFPPESSDIDDLTQLDILLAGPTHTPFADGVWKLHLTIPTTYPQSPPTAHFRTPIFHPNVDVQTGGVCVETLKRDWDARLTLRDVLVTISCLLIQPNPDSALNADAGALIQEDYDAFARRAKLMTSIHAVVPRNLREAVREAQMRGQEVGMDAEDGQDDEESVLAQEPAAPSRRRRTTARQRGTTTARRSEGSPSAATAMRRRLPVGSSNPFVLQTDTHDPFGSNTTLRQGLGVHLEDEDSSMVDADQENDESRSPIKLRSPVKAVTPRRPPGTPVPLGELPVDEEEPRSDSESSDDEFEREYPPSPRKSPSKSPAKWNHGIQADNRSNIPDQAESSRTAAARAPNITPPMNLITQPLAEDSPFALSASPRKTRRGNALFTPPKASLFPAPRTPGSQRGVAKKTANKGRTSPGSSSSSEEKKRRKAELDDKLWALCGGDIRRWNCGEFDGDVMKVKARRW